MEPRTTFRTVFGRAFLICLYLFAPLGAWAGGPEDARLRVALVWGTNDDKSKFPDKKEVAPGVKKKMQKVFKWKTYLEMKQELASVKKGAEESIRISPKCIVKIRNFGTVDAKHPRKKKQLKIRVQLIGEGKRVINHTQGISEGQTLTLAGNDKNDTAWFVVVNRLPLHSAKGKGEKPSPKAPDKK